ncbi:MAG: sensor histidine kinase [Actinomycetota bacterium]
MPSGESNHDVQVVAARLAETERLNEELRARNRVVQEFVAITSHELRSPLASIGGFASTLLHYWDSISEEDKKKYLSVIDKQVQRINRLIDDLLTVSRIEAGALESSPITLNAVGAIRQALQEVGPEGAEVGVEGDEDLEVFADPDQLQQMLVNYLVNALKYGAAPVWVEARDASSSVEIRVRDSGEGIPDDFIPQLFQKYARADTAASRKSKGTGLGLAVVRGLAEANGGEAWYEPEPMGACFAVRLPKP